jgi:hypothetical protein
VATAERERRGGAKSSPGARLGMVGMHSSPLPPPPPPAKAASSCVIATHNSSSAAPRDASSTSSAHAGREEEAHRPATIQAASKVAVRRARAARMFAGWAQVVGLRCRLWSGRREQAQAARQARRRAAGAGGVCVCMHGGVHDM